MKLSGDLSGVVRNATGAPQMGAVVYLHDRLERLVGRVLTNESGLFTFPALPPDLYKVRVSLASYMPAARQGISVQPGRESVLNISLANVFSSIELVYTAPRGAMMTDEWKWALRAATATRPVLRYLPGTAVNAPAGGLFTETRGILRLSAGDAGTLATGGAEPDLGTAFALATSLRGVSQLQFSGNVGYVPYSGTPVAGFRAAYSRRGLTGETGPVFHVTMRQVLRPGGRMQGDQLTNSGPPALRSASMGVFDSMRFGDGALLEYGSSLDSLFFFERLTYLSPFARLSLNVGAKSMVQLAYSSGSAPLELLNQTGVRNTENGQTMESEFSGDLAALALFPRLTVRGDATRLQRSRNFELAYRWQSGSRTFRMGAHHESVGDAAVTMAAQGPVFPSEDLLPDLSSGNYLFNAGRFQSLGFTMSATQTLGERMEATVAYGNGGFLSVAEGALSGDSASDVRNRMQLARRNWVAMRFSGTAPVLGTRYSVGYQWLDQPGLTNPHVYLTDNITTQPGLNVRVRQPIPTLGFLPFRMEASADLRNLLEQGYVPLRTQDGRQMLLIPTPKTVRGSVSFIF